MLRALFRQLDPEDMGTVGLPLLLECLCEHSPDQGAKTSAVGGEGGRSSTRTGRGGSSRGSAPSALLALLHRGLGGRGLRRLQKGLESLSRRSPGTKDVTWGEVRVTEMGSSRKTVSRSVVTASSTSQSLDAFRSRARSYVPLV